MEFTLSLFYCSHFLGIITFAQLHAYKTAIPDENVLFLFTASYHKHVLRFDYPDATVDDVCQGHDLRLAVCTHLNRLLLVNGILSIY